MEKRSSFVGNPPVGLDVEPGLLLRPGGAAVGALAHPPKSSSAETVGWGLGAGFPQADPRSFAVIVSGTFMLIVLAGAFGSGGGSGVLHASLPHGSILPENRLADTAGGGG